MAQDFLSSISIHDECYLYSLREYIVLIWRCIPKRTFCSSYSLFIWLA